MENGFGRRSEKKVRDRCEKLTCDPRSLGMALPGFSPALSRSRKRTACACIVLLASAGRTLSASRALTRRRGGLTSRRAASRR